MTRKERYVIAVLRSFFAFVRRRLGRRDPYAYVRHEIFKHAPRADERCYVCGKELRKNVTQVGSGERMHSKCWLNFFSKKVSSMKEGRKLP